MEAIEDIPELEINENILAELSWLFYECGPIPINSYAMKSAKSEKKRCDQMECDTKFGFFDTKVMLQSH